MLTPIQSFTPIDIILQTIFYKYLINTYCLTIVSDKKLEAYIYKIPLTYIDPNDLEYFPINMLNSSEMGCSDYLVKMSNPALFIDTFEENIHVGNARRSDRKVIFIAPSNEQEDIASLLNILDMKGSQFIANILMILPTKNTMNGKDCESFDFVTHQYVGKVNNDAPVLLDTWNGCTGRFDNNANLFPYDMTDMQGKTLRLACFTYKPYVLLDLDKSIAPLGYDGTELRTVTEFCKWINCTIELVRNDENQWGEIFENRTGNGVLGNLVEDRADIGITALYMWFHEYRFLDLSMPGIRSGITCLTPAPRLLPSWMLPVLPFSSLMWGAVVMTFFLTCSSLILAQRGSSDRVMLTTFGILVSQTQPDSVTVPGQRYIIGWLLMTALVLDNAYSSGLASVFTVSKYDRSIDTVQDLVDANIEWGGTHDAWTFSILSATEPNLVELVKKFAIYKDEVLQRKGFTRDYAFSIERLPAGHFAVGDYVKEEAIQHLKLMEDDIYWEQCPMMARKSSPYTRKYNQLLSRLQSFGILLGWETQVVLQHSNYKVQLGIGQSLTLRRQLELGALNYQKVLGAFIMLMFGCIASTVLFIAELVHGRAKRPYIIIM